MARIGVSRCSAEGCGNGEEPKSSAGERIFAAARRMFYARGIRAVGVDEIVAEAGVTKPSLYRAFASKDALVAACLEECTRETSKELDAMLEGMSADPGERLEAIVAFYATRMQQPDFRGCPLSNTAVEFPEPGHPGRTAAEAGKTLMRQRLLDLTRQLAVPDPDALADGIMLVIEGAMASHHLFGSQGPSSAMLATARALIAAHIGQAVH